MKKNEDVNNEEDEEEENETFFDSDVMKILANIVLCENEVQSETYTLLQNSFEDFFRTLVSNTFILKNNYGEEQINEEDLKVVISLWKNSPYESTNSLIQKIVV